MAKADVLQLVTDISDGLADATLDDTYYADVVLEMAASPDTTLIGMATSFITPPADGVYTVPTTDATYLLEVLFDGMELMRATVAEATMYDPDYVRHSGTPLSWIEEHEDFLKVRLVPRPALAPVDGVTFIYGEARTDVHADEELAVALEVLAREMSRDSDHTDKTFAQAARSLSTLCFQLLGLALVPRRFAANDNAQ